MYVYDVAFENSLINFPMLKLLEIKSWKFALL